MKYEWDPAKNQWLKENRDISFEQVIYHLSRGDIWKIADHPDRENYPGQKIYFVIVENYVYLVPHIIDVEKKYIFLKTVIPSRKATKMHKDERKADNEI